MACVAVLELVAYAVAGLVALGAVTLPIWAIVVLRRRQDAIRRQDPPDGAPPPTAIVLPVKGDHQGLAANLDAILDQDHPDLLVRVVVDDVGDPAVPTIEAVLAKHDDLDAELVVVEEASDLGSFRIGKARAHAAGLEAVPDDREALLFCDADARPRRDWARRMTAPLADPPEAGGPGAVTAYRWYVSEDHGTWSRLRAQWNGAGHDALLDEDVRFCWGGSMAVRRDLFEARDVLDRMRDAIADDVALTEAVREAGGSIRYEPRAACLNVEDCDAYGCLEWCVRQTAIVRETMPDLWRFAAAVYALSVGLFAVGTGLALAGTVASDPVLATLGAAFLVPVLSTPARTRLRWSFFRQMLADDGDRLRDEPDDEGLAVLLPFFSLAVILASALTDRIAWRGRTYKIGRS